MATLIPRRPLGRQGLEVSAIGLGCMGMSDFYGASDERENRAVLNRAIDLGVNFLDTADMYGVGANEQLLSQVLKTRRHEVVLATKFGVVREAGSPMARGVNGRPEYVRQACDASLKRLGIEQIDLYYQHRVDPAVPIEETVGAMAELVKAGKVRFLGLSEASGNTVRRAAKVHPISALQSEYSLWTREVETDGLAACRELGIGFVAYSPLGRGFLAGRFHQTEDLAPDDYRRHSPRFTDDALRANRQLLDAITGIAAAREATPAQLALAWLLDRGADIVPIPGTRKISRLEENAAATMIHLSDAERQRIESALKATAVVGERYPEAAMKMVNA